MERVDVDGLTIAYLRAGDGPPLLLLHGGVSDGPTTWWNQIDEFAHDHTVIAWDAPGAGASDDPPEMFGMDGYASCVAGFIRALGLDAVHLMGHSFGGAVALAVAARHADLVRSLVLVSAYAGWRGSLGDVEAGARLDETIALSRRSGAEVADALLPTMFAVPVAGFEAAAFRKAIVAFHPAGMRAMAAACAEDLSALLPEVVAPTLIVYGSADTRAPWPVAGRLHDGIASSRLVVIEGAGHECNTERPQVFNDAVRVFFAGAPV